MKNKKQVKGGNRKMEMKKIVLAILALTFVSMFLLGSIQSVIAQSGSNSTNSGSSGTSNSNGTTSSGSFGDAIIPTNSDGSPIPTQPGSGTITYTPSYVNIYLEPEKQKSDNGQAKYEVVVRDEHPFVVCAFGLTSRPTSSCPQDPPQQAYKYKLSFNSKYGMKGEFEDKEVLLTPGEKKVVSLYVQAENKGENFFEVVVSGDDAKASARGLLIYGKDDTTPSEPVSYFNGAGFALNEDENIGYLVKLHLIKNGALEGKMSIDNRNFRVSGDVEEGKIKLSLSGIDNKALYGSFNGEIDNFKTFSLIRGTLELEGKKFKVTLMGERESVFKIITPTLVGTSTGQPVETKVGEITVIEGKQTTSTAEEAKQEVIIKPTEVKNEKILWIFPTGKVLVAEVTAKDGKTYKQKFKENSESEVEGYNVKVGGLENADKIPIEITKVE